VGVVGVEISAFPLTWHIAYTTACCYRTSRDWFWRNSLLQCVWQPQIAKKVHKTPCFGAQGHSRSLNWAPQQQQPWPRCEHRLTASRLELKYATAGTACHYRRTPNSLNQPTALLRCKYTRRLEEQNDANVIEPRRIVCYSTSWQNRRSRVKSCVVIWTSSPTGKPPSCLYCPSCLHFSNTQAYMLHCIALPFVQECMWDLCCRIRR